MDPSFSSEPKQRLSSQPPPNMTIEEQEKQEENCTKKIVGAMNHGKIRRIIDSMNNLGCNIPDDFFSCKYCLPSEEIVAAFEIGETNNRKISLCQDIISKYNISQKFVTETLVHELIHAYDFCRAKVDAKNCFHLACTEVRASNLSGECRLLNEYYRGNYSPFEFKFANIGEKCIFRRAVKSLKNHDQCSEKAEFFVKTVMKECAEDEAPLMLR